MSKKAKKRIFGYLSLLSMIVLFVFSSTLMAEDHNANGELAAKSKKFVYRGKPIFAYGFSDHMVLQRDTKVNVWGLASPGRVVMVSINGRSDSAKADELGKWLLQLPSMSAGGPYKLVLRSGDDIAELEDVMIGDVWICSGQSNMRWELARRVNESVDPADPFMYTEALERIKKHKGRNIRHFMRWGNNQQSPWVPVNFENASNNKVYPLGVTTVGYFFAENLRKHLGDVPIGIVQVGMGGQGIRQFIAKDVPWADPELKQFCDWSWKRLNEDKPDEAKAYTAVTVHGDFNFKIPPPKAVSLKPPCKGKINIAQGQSDEGGRHPG